MAATESSIRDSDGLPSPVIVPTMEMFKEAYQNLDIKIIEKNIEKIDKQIIDEFKNQNGIPPSKDDIFAMCDKGHKGFKIIKCNLMMKKSKKRLIYIFIAIAIILIGIFTWNKLKS